MITVALIGPDGSGKSSITMLLPAALSDLPIKRVYMGINLEASNLMLPTTRLLLMMKRKRGGRPDISGALEPEHGRSSSKSPIKRLVKGIRAWLLLGNRVAEEWFRLVISAWYLNRGYHVLFDRYFALDYYFYDMQYSDQGQPLTRRIHGYLLNRFYPRPQLVICLDAPAEVLFARKGEGTLASLEQRRLEYLSLRQVLPSFCVIDATQPTEQVVEQAADIIRKFVAASESVQPPVKPSGQPGREVR